MADQKNDKLLISSEGSDFSPVTLFQSGNAIKIRAKKKVQISRVGDVLANSSHNSGLPN